MILGLIFSIFSCKFFKGQGYIDSFKALPNYFYILLYFGLSVFKPSIKQLEKTLLFLIFTFNIIYISQFILLQKGIVFLPSVERSIDAGSSARFRMIASGLTSLGLFYGLNKYSLFKKKTYLILTLTSISVLMLMAFRTMIFFSAAMSLFLIYKMYGFNWKLFRWIGLAGVLIIALLLTPIIQEKMQYMLDKNETETLLNSDYVRIRTMDYYLNHHFKNYWEMFFGSGVPFPGTKYHESTLRVRESGIYSVDWGLWGNSWIVGVISVLSMIWYSIKSSRLKVEPKYYYLGVWFLYLVLTSITTAEFYRAGNFVIQALVLYTIELVVKQNNLTTNY